MDLIDLQPVKPGYGQVWQGSELSVLFDSVLQPRLIISLIGEAEPMVANSLTAFMRDNDETWLPDPMLFAMCESAVAFLKRGHNILIHCFQGKYRSTYMDVAIHMKMGMLFADAFGLIRQRHTIADLRAGTRAQLVRLESALTHSL